MTLTPDTLKVLAERDEARAALSHLKPNSGAGSQQTRLSDEELRRMQDEAITFWSNRCREMEERAEKAETDAAAAREVLENLLNEMAQEFADERIGYEVVQITRGERDRAKVFLSSPTPLAVARLQQRFAALEEASSLLESAALLEGHEAQRKLWYERRQAWRKMMSVLDHPERGG